MEKHEAPIIQITGFKTFHLVIIVVLIVQAFFLGSLWTKVEVLKSGNTAAVPQQTTGQVAGAQQQAVQQQPVAPAVTLDQVKDTFSKSLIKFGDSNNKLVFIEVADPSCPYCHIAGGLNGELNKQVGDRFTLVSDGGSYVAPVPEMKKLLDGGKAAFAWIYSPGHGNGEMGTKAMYCAFERGKFWEVHDALMTSEGYDLLNNTVKNDKAKSEELSQFLVASFDPAEMKTCLDSGKYDARLSEDVGLARGIGVSGTPGFFVNETNFAGAYSFKDMESAVNAAL
ncbi:DsbA family protein [Candidatus Gottesmanbacteria bacterium]|nr:DsbA family protein [Candidatus Gottesmanbacteria bacterium]